MPQLFLLASLLLCAVFHLSPVFAQQSQPVRLVTGLAWGFTELTFDEKLDADASFNTITATGALSRANLYALFSHSSSLATENISEEDEIGSAERTDRDLTLGYRTSANWSIFAGYRKGSTDIDFTIRDTTIRQNEFYREKGYFAGASYTLRLGRSGNLGFTLAYTRFDSDLKFTAGADDDDEEEEEEPVEFDDLEGRQSGESSGYSAGISWVVPLGNSLAMRAQYKVNYYDLEVVADGVRYKPAQRLVYFNLGLLYAF